MKLLVVRYSALGDVILVTGVIRFLKNIGMFDEIDVMTDRDFSFIFENNKNVNRIIEYDRKMSLWNYFEFLQKWIDGYDVILDLQGKPRTILLKLFSDAKYVGYGKKSFKRRMFVKYRLFEDSLNDHVTKRYLGKFLKGINVKLPPLKDLRPEIFLGKEVSKDNTIAIHPFASKNTKVWPYFRNLADMLIKNGYKVKVIGRGEENLFESEGLTNLVNKTSLQQMFEEIKKSSLLITTDSGPMHAAISLNVKTLAIFGSTSYHLGFYPEFENCYVIENNIKCRPCDVHGLKKCPEGHFRCMKDIGVEQVFEKVREVLM